jgi:hypothetical protein
MIYRLITAVIKAVYAECGFISIFNKKPQLFDSEWIIIFIREEEC